MANKTITDLTETTWPNKAAVFEVEDTTATPKSRKFSLDNFYKWLGGKLDGITALVSDIFVFWHNSTGTPGAGFGSRLLWKLQSSTTVDRDAAQLNVVWRDAADATRSAGIELGVVDKAATLDSKFFLEYSTLGTNRYPSLGIGARPQRQFHLKNTEPAAASMALFENADSTDNNGLVFSFRSTTTGAGGAAQAELCGFRAVFPVHDHATRQGEFHFYVINAGAVEVWKVKPGFQFGYGDLSTFTKLLGTRKTGWGAPTGTADRTTFDQSTVTTAELAKRVKALIDDLTSHGLIGAS